MSSGWPDLIIRDARGVHLWLELKICKGLNDRIKVRPEQINWAEDHASIGGLTIVFAKCGDSHFRAVDPQHLRLASKSGCLSMPLYSLSDLGRVVRHRMGYHVNLQQSDPASIKGRAGLGEKARSGSRRRTIVPRLSDPWL